MYVPSNTPKYVCYKCRNKIGLEDLEGVFHEQLKGFFFSTSEITRYLEQADKTLSDKETRLEALEKELREIQSGMDKTYHLYLDDKITSNEFGVRYKPLEQRKKQFLDQMPEVQAEIDFLKIKNLSSDQILTEARDLYGRWPDLRPEEKRQIIENIAEKITIGKDEVAIDLSYLPSSSKIAATESRILRDSWRRRA
jgi:site-specific DNA recombinase